MKSFGWEAETDITRRGEDMNGARVISFSFEREEKDQNSGHHRFWQTHMAIYSPKDRKQQFVFSNFPFL